MGLRFEHPWALLAMTAIPLVFWLRRMPTLSYSSLQLLDCVTIRSWRQRLHWTPDVVRLMSLAAIVVAIAQPQTPIAESAIHENGASIIVCVDVSGSMGRVESLDSSKRSMTRLDQVKAAVIQILTSAVRKHDAVGVVTFALVPEIRCALSTDHDGVRELVEKIEVTVLDNRTNIGDAVALAIDLLQRSSGRERIIILASDGSQNVETAIPVGQAARIAESFGVRVHCLDISQPDDAIGEASSEPGRATLMELARLTGGDYWSTASVEQKLSAPTIVSEKQEAPQIIGYKRWRDWFVECLYLALLLWAAEAALRTTWFHTTPTGFMS